MGCLTMDTDRGAQALTWVKPSPMFSYLSVILCCRVSQRDRSGATGATAQWQVKVVVGQRPILGEQVATLNQYC